MISISAIIIVLAWAATDEIQSIDNTTTMNESNKAQAVNDYLIIQKQKEEKEQAENAKWRKIQADIKKRDKEMEQYVRENSGKPRPNRLYDPNLSKPLEEISKPYQVNPEDLKEQPPRKSALERVREKIQEREDREEELRNRQQAEESQRKKQEEDAEEERKLALAKQSELENKLKLKEHRNNSAQSEAKLPPKDLLVKLKTDQHTFQEAVKHYQQLKKEKQDELNTLTAELAAKSKKAM